MIEARFYSKEGQGLRCKLCPNLCFIEEGEAGVCRVRVNSKGKLVARGYGEASAIAMDPMEKKPLYHFYPGSEILSIGGLGCNLKCNFCQNWRIAHNKTKTRFISPENLVALAKGRNSRGIAFTYNEPIINYEYILDTAFSARDLDLKVVLITNGYIMQEPLKELLPLVDAMNIDVKGFTQDYYRDICGGSLHPVKRTAETAAGRCHIELTTLIVGGYNDGMEVMEGLFSWVKGIDPNIVLHLSRYFPNYKMDSPATPVSDMISLKELGKEYLNYIYLGNIAESDNNTYCHSCGNLLVSRDLFGVNLKGIVQGKCNNCETPIPIVL
ncbi:MAG: AmmeMemoRadiSam system radical SAM enzyme [Clostridiales bacterium]|nr:AmmeMemoRadiSam system radical SAM enzyme [Clostridiales bacterium]